MDEDIYVWWKSGIWKVILDHGFSDMARIRWVRGPRPDEGVLHDVPLRHLERLTAMEVLGLMSDDEIVP